ncbi:protoporphyrin IX magnesium-chelatase [Cognatiyoonia koreensis]|uniref:Protoporphyrin IX magnesium-chelatase n=2 Tax=Cognatiyoonia koreensis TaxID=364200 RepID=A0A1I0RRL8_9RHOB|nr:protoporphyrin IX magnesium-chelatase [Cognatiyoonia koreensis]
MAVLALRLIAIDPMLGGVCIRARAGSVRQSLMAAFPPNPVKLHPTMTTDVLTGGLDLSATLAQGRMVMQAGLLSAPGPLLLAMAERTPQQMAALLGQTLDRQAGHTLILLDEGAENDEATPASLIERVAFHVDLNATPATDAIIPPAGQVVKTPVRTPDDLIEKTVSIAGELGVESGRALQFVLRAARALAVLFGKDHVSDDLLALACKMVLSHRATRIPEPEPSEAPDEQDTQAQDSDKATDDTLTLPDDLLLDAVLANLPPNLLAQLQTKSRTGKGSGSGARLKGNRRGRPLPSRNGRKADGARIDVIGTLRNAAPWQTIRKQQTGRDGIHIRSGDIQIKRFEDRSDRLLIFAVDASGSAALARLAEAKGAVELLLAEAYARRDHVALIAFRGDKAEALLPPTRSLVQTKRRLAELPGGGGTPLAAGMEAALEQALHARRKGMTPTICILTDGRANIARDGTANRQQAANDAQTIARAIRGQSIDSIVIDTGNRPEPKLRDLAHSLDATYLPMPRAKAERMSAAVAAALDA